MVSLLGLKTTLMTHIDNPIGLYALIGLLVLFLIYLIRPKPLQKTIPSLIFLTKDKGKSKKESFFQKLLRDFLLIFHFLLIAILAISVMQPFFFTDKDISKEHTVIVLDTSASMDTSETSIHGTSIFDKAVGKAKGYISDKTSIVIVDNEPLILLQAGKEEEAVEIFDSLEPKNSLSSIGNSILAAGDLLSGEKGRVVVISDMINTDSVEPIIAKKTLEAKGVHVELVILAESKKNNIGIVDLDISEKETKITVHNYNDVGQQFDVEINGVKKNIAILPDMDEKLIFENKEGENIAKLLIKDDFELDNEVHVYTPVKKKIRALLITNEAQSYILPALSAYGLTWDVEMEIETAEPPKMPRIDHDLIILGSVDANKLPSGAIDKIAKLVKDEGASFVIAGSPTLHQVNLKKLMPVELNSLANQPSEVFNLQSINEITGDLSFSKVDNYYKAKTKKGATALANTNDNSTIIAISDYGSGKVAYYGVFDTQSKFKFDISYPLFWQQLIDYMMGAENVNNINYEIGEKLVFDNDIQIITPQNKKLKQTYVQFDMIGEYTIKGRKAYVNLINERESNINYVTDSGKEKAYEEDIGVANIKKPLITYLIYAALAMLFIELLYIKVRGDL
jgi:hypothetical protein